MQRIKEFLQECCVFYLATAEGDQPRVRPFGALCEFDGGLYLITANTKPVYAQLRANPRAEISATAADGRWLRLSAVLREDDRREARQAMLEANPGLRSMYSEDDGKMVVLRLTEAKAAICSFTAPPVTVEF